jgi:hypothetical protein
MPDSPAVFPCADLCLVERAGARYGVARLPDDALRLRARSAPPEVRQLIDRQRESRGLPPLWSPSSSSTRGQTAARVRRLRAYVARMRGALTMRTATATDRHAPTGRA